MNILIMVWTLALMHLIGDFFLQSQWMSENKSKSLVALNTHVCIYTAVFSLLFISYPPREVVLFLMWTYLFHLATDFCTSKITKRLWEKQDYHNFFVVIGVDQFLHTLQLTALGYYLFIV